MKKHRYILWLLPVFIIGGYFVLDSLLFDGIKPQKISDNGIQANYYAQEGIKNKPCVILIGGGPSGDYWAAQFAAKGYVGVSLAYYRQEGLPQLMEEIPLEYFEKAMKRIGDQAEVDPEKIILMGASRNAELALVIASNLPDFVSGVIAYAPSAISWSNTVLPFNSNTLKASWTYQGESIPYLPMEKIKAPVSAKLSTLEYWQEGLGKVSQYEEAIIKVEKIQGPILLLSGKDDQIWPSALMSDMIIQRLKSKDFPHEFESIEYDDAGHLISRNLEMISQGRVGSMKVGEKVYEFEYGGTIEGDKRAIIHASESVLSFLQKIDSE